MDGNSSIFELVQRTKKFIRLELVHATVTVAIFFGIFLVLQPWKYNYESSEDRPYWMAGLPLVYFMGDLLLALMLHFTMLNELRPRTCKLWIILQVVNLILLTLLGFYMVWQIEFVNYTYLNLSLALLVLYAYKAYRISIMNKLIRDMTIRCSMSNVYTNNRPAFTISVQQQQQQPRSQPGQQQQQPSPVPVRLTFPAVAHPANVKQESSA